MVYDVIFGLLTRHSTLHEMSAPSLTYLFKGNYTKFYKITKIITFWWVVAPAKKRYHCPKKTLKPTKCHGQPGPLFCYFRMAQWIRNCHVSSIRNLYYNSFFMCTIAQINLVKTIQDDLWTSKTDWKNNKILHYLSKLQVRLYTFPRYW